MVTHGQRHAPDNYSSRIDSHCGMTVRGRLLRVQARTDPPSLRSEETIKQAKIGTAGWPTDARQVENLSLTPAVLFVFLEPCWNLEMFFIAPFSVGVVLLVSRLRHCFHSVSTNAQRHLNATAKSRTDRSNTNNRHFSLLYLQVFGGSSRHDAHHAHFLLPPALRVHK